MEQYVNYCNKLIDAIKSYHTDKAQELLESENVLNFINLKDEYSNTPLHVALKNANPDPEIIKLLLEKGADINYSDEHDETPFVLMIKNKKLWNSHLFQKVKEYIKDHHKKDELNLDIEYRYRWQSNDDKINKNLDGENYLHIAARAKNKDAFLFITKLCDYKQRNIMLGQNNMVLNGNTPLHEAAISGVLFHLIRELLQDLEEMPSSPKDQEKLKSVEKSIEAEIKNLKRSKSNIKKILKRVNKHGYTPIASLGSAEAKKEIKDYLEIKDPLIPKYKFNKIVLVLLSLVTAAVWIASLYLLYTHSAGFALNAVVASLGSCNSLLWTQLYSTYDKDFSNNTLYDPNVELICEPQDQAIMQG
ncbi:hypothetical protein BIY23_03410 [Wolbachia pipientis]|uniref:Uncharacterized protein n=2 Tax=Wolbachia pipientis TaxID=955 RepID=A0A1E7QJD8_WOLPI|nr:hypothetical protein BIY23_03410 [Wolbachia pipientis]